MLEPDGSAGLPVTISMVEVVEPIAVAAQTHGIGGAPIAKKSMLRVQQLGGRAPDGCLVVPNDERLLQVGDEELLFLDRQMGGVLNKQDAIGLFVIAGGPSGHLPIVADRVVAEIDKTFAPLHGSPVSNLAGHVRGLAEKRPLGTFNPATAAVPAGCP
jgi:hypothetical protein